MKLNYCSFNGKKIAYYKSGAGLPLVFLHGFLESSLIWQEIAAHFSKKYLVLCIDLPGHGYTDVFAETHAVSLMSDAVNEVMKAESIKKAIVVGHSMGGYTALNFSERYNEKIIAMALVHSTAYPDSEEKKKDRDRAARVMELSPKVFIAEAIPNLFARQNLDRLRDIIENQKEEALRTPIAGAVACLRGMKIREDKTSVLEKSEIPVLFIAGTDDNVVPLRRSMEQIEMNKKIQGVIIENCGHMSFYEAPEQLKNALENFVSKIYS